MLGLANLDWLYHALGWTLAAAGVVLLVWALFWDRSRGRRRCPKCWYSMEGVPGLRCPECGREAKSESGLLRTRRRRWVAVIAVAIIAAGYPIYKVPRIVAGGWRGAVPSTALIAALPWLDHETVADMAAANATLPLGKSLYHELIQNRLMEDSLAAWQRRWLLAHLMHGDRLRPACSEAWDESFRFPLVWLLQGEPRGFGASLREDEVKPVLISLAKAGLHTRDRWPEHTPLYLECRCFDLCLGTRTPRDFVAKAEIDQAAELHERLLNVMGSCFVADTPWTDRERMIGVTGGAQNAVRVHLTLTESGGTHGPLIDDDVDLPVQISGSLNDVMHPFRSPEIETLIRERLKPHIVHAQDEQGFWRLAVDLASWSIPDETERHRKAAICKAKQTLGVRLELLRAGEMVATGRAWWHGDSFLFPWSQKVLLDLVDKRPVVNSPSDEWQLRITGDGEVALRDFASTEYWDGTVTVNAVWGERTAQEISRTPAIDPQ